MKVKSRKLIIFFILILMCCALALPLSGRLFSSAQEGTATTLNDGDKRLSQSYLDAYAVPSSEFTPYTDRGGDDTLKYAFDRNWNTAYKAAQETNDGTLQIVFNDQVKLSGIIFAIAQDTTNQKPNGYPATLTIYGDDDKLVASITSTPSKNKMLFSFDTITCNTIKLKFTMNGSYNWRQTASEIIFMQPEIEGVENLFANYCQTELNEQYKSESALDELLNKLATNINYETAFKPMIERARKILNEEITFNEEREFSTEENAFNKIEQHGDIATYCRTTLKMRYMGTNRQITGIYGKAGEEINVYVEAQNPSAPLPKIQFSQFNGYLMDDIGNNTWLGGEQTLSNGKNTFTFPTFNLQGASVIGGGSIYITNPFTEEQGIVKVYIEGGHDFPIFRKGENESDYLASLDDFISQSEEHIDITEMQGENVIITVDASRAQHNYRSNPEVTPQQNLDKWDEYIKKLLVFDGITLNQEEQYYNDKNQYINVNIRLMQPEPGAAAYAGYEHIGIFVVEGSAEWLNNAIQMSQYGWGFAHEIGHMLDLPERTVAECSNNMFSMYALTYITHALREPSFYENTLSEMMSPTKQSLFEDGKRSNYLLWWYIENYFPGYWGKLDNLYRFGESIEGLTPTEKQVYLSSLATGIDLSYYFEKWGYSLTGSETDGKFSYATSSDAFKELMAEKIDDESIDNSIKPPIWYAKKGNDPSENKQIYNSSQKLEAEVSASENGYLITMPEPSNPAHLGYEIYVKEGEEYRLLAFTYDNVFEDNNSYSSQPEYEIVAIDTSFHTTAMPEIIEQNEDDNEPSLPGNNETPKSKTGLIVGIVLGSAVLLAVIIVIFIIAKKRKRTN